MNVQPFCINVKRFRRGLVLKAHRLGVSLNSRLESDDEEEEEFLSSQEKRLRALGEKIHLSHFCIFIL